MSDPDENRSRAMSYLETLQQTHGMRRPPRVDKEAFDSFRQIKDYVGESDTDSSPVGGGPRLSKYESELSRDMISDLTKEIEDIIERTVPSNEIKSHKKLLFGSLP